MGNPGAERAAPARLLVVSVMDTLPRALLTARTALGASRGPGIPLAPVAVAPRSLASAFLHFFRRSPAQAIKSVTLSRQITLEQPNKRLCFCRGATCFAAEPCSHERARASSFSEAVINS